MTTLCSEVHSFSVNRQALRASGSSDLKQQKPSLKLNTKGKTITGFLGVSLVVPLPFSCLVFKSWGSVSSLPALVTQHSCLRAHRVLSGNWSGFKNSLVGIKDVETGWVYCGIHNCHDGIAIQGGGFSGEWQGKVVDMCIWEDIGRNVPREVLQAFMKERGKRYKLIKERKYI